MTPTAQQQRGARGAQRARQTRRAHQRQYAFAHFTDYFR
jgi:hypothetical protein